MNRLSPAEASARPWLIKVWDGPTRLFHWLLVLLIVSAYLTRTYCNDPTLYLHRLNGYAVLTLLIFRVFWGLVGSSTSRFAAFFPTPTSVFSYGWALLRGRRLHYLGHNPLGSVLILLMLLAVAAQAGSGLFTSDDAIAQGPLHDHVTDVVSGRAASYHARGFWLILALAGIHISANLTYQFAFRDRLITSMVTGTKPAGDYIDQNRAELAPTARAALCLIVAAGIVAGSVMIAGDSLLH